ncbi:Maf family protein [Wenzhouxiangella sp. XN24]|uniref:Maf family protein n=1 Tax=Wenzhouxiangella sp. XN24 TaxID=2713569 RepID=UPI0013ECA2FF|nr:Maf family protein [Wenzhouxiangella sp. XN24]NGX15914.1 septum formation inhibitor Maf [Wenzhouxiangella sp. XN24]
MDSLNLVLASASPRRRQLLASLGLACEVAPTHIDETPLPGEDPADYARRLAAEKAVAGAARHPPGRLLLAADTVVALGREILGKPADEQDAARMLRRLSGRTHEVHTAVAARQDDSTAMRLATTEVTFRSLRDSEIEAYVGSGEPLDKAGAYGIQGVAAIFVTRLSGSYSGVVGLPLCETAELLREFGVEVPGLATGGDA